jgi:hypothetical protein
MNITSIIRNETMILGIFVAVCGVISGGVLIAAWLCGLDLSAIFLGTPWDSPHAYTRGIIALEGGIVAITLLFGGFFVAGIMALIMRR